MVNQRQHTVAYWGIYAQIASYGVSDALDVPLETCRAAAAMRTRLNPLSRDEGHTC